MSIHKIAFRSSSVRAVEVENGQSFRMEQYIHPEATEDSPVIIVPGTQLCSSIEAEQDRQLYYQLPNMLLIHFQNL